MKTEDCSVGVGGVCKMAGAAWPPAGGVRGVLIAVLRDARAGLSMDTALGAADVSRDGRSLGTWECQLN